MFLCFVMKAKLTSNLFRPYFEVVYGRVFWVNCCIFFFVFVPRLRCFWAKNVGAGDTVVVFKINVVLPVTLKTGWLTVHSLSLKRRCQGAFCFEVLFSITSVFDRLTVYEPFTCVFSTFLTGTQLGRFWRSNFAQGQVLGVLLTEIYSYNNNCTKLDLLFWSIFITISTYISNQISVVWVFSREVLSGPNSA